MRREQRLGSSGDYERVRRTGRRWAHPMLILWAAPGQAGDTPTRVGVTVSRRIGGAVARNRVRRRVLESVRLEHERIRPGWDLVFAARSGAAEASFAALRAAVVWLLEKAGLGGGVAV